MRPDRSVVIRHWIVSGFSSRQSANSPTGEEARLHQSRGDACGAIGTGNAAEQDLTCIRRAYAAGIFCAVERKCVSLDLRAPECGLKALRETGRFSIELERKGLTPEALRYTCRRAFGGVDITLHFGKRDIALGQSSVSVEYRVVRILPALIGESLFGRAFCIQ